MKAKEDKVISFTCRSGKKRTTRCASCAAAATATYLCMLLLLNASVIAIESIGNRNILRQQLFRRRKLNEDSYQTSDVTSPPTTKYGVTLIDDPVTGFAIFESVCDETYRSPGTYSPVVPYLISYKYALTLLPGMDHVVKISTIEGVMHEYLSSDLMQDCTFRKDNTTAREKEFEIMGLSSAPNDKVSENETCGNDCRVIQGHVTAAIFYIDRRLQGEDTITSPTIINAFGDSILKLFGNSSLFGSDVVSLIFQGFTNNAVYDTLGDGEDLNKNDLSVSAVESHSDSLASVKRGLGGGAAVTGVAAIALLAVCYVGLRLKRKDKSSSDEKMNNTFITDELNQSTDQNERLNRTSEPTNYKIKVIKPDVSEYSDEEIESQKYVTDNNTIIKCDEIDAKNADFNTRSHNFPNDVAHVVDEDDELSGYEIYNTNVQNSFRRDIRPPIFVSTNLGTKSSTKDIGILDNNNRKSSMPSIK